MAMAVPFGPACPTSHEHAFVGFLHGLVERGDRAALADLRRGFGRSPGRDLGSHRYVAKWVDGFPWRRAQLYYLVAAAFAWVPTPWRGRRDASRSNFGASMALLCSGGAAGRIRPRFEALVESSGGDALVDGVCTAIELMKAKGVRIDHAQLLHDLLRWGGPGSPVRSRWATSFYCGVSAAAAE